MNVATNQEFYAIAGWTLIHFLWQGMLFGALVWLALQLCNRSNAKLRYLLLCAGFSASAMCPVVTFAWLAISPHAPSQVIGSLAPDTETLLNEDSEPILSGAVLHTVGSTTGQQNQPLHPTADSNEFSPTNAGIPESFKAWLETVQECTPYLILIWCIGVCVLSLRLIVRWTRTQKIKGNGIALDSLESNSMHATMKVLCQKLGIRKAVRLCRTHDIDTPTVIGWMQPVILFPAAAMTGLTPDQMSAILAHELAHIRRHDYLINLFQSVVEILLFYHPVVWWMSAEIRAERENCCDDLAVAVCTNRRDYIEALLQLETQRGATNALAMAASGGSLLQRVSRMLGTSPNDSQSTNWLCGLISLVIAGVVFSCILPEQQSTGQVQPETVEQQDDRTDDSDADELSDENVKIDFTILVVDSNGEPISNANIYMSASQEGPQVSNKYNIATNADGFVTQKIQKSTTRVRVWCRAKGFAPLFANWEPAYFSSGKILPKEFTFIMYPAETIGGRIVDSDGEPIKGAKLQVSYGSGGTPPLGDRQKYNIWLAYGSAAVVTDDDGRWVLENIPPGDDVEVSLMVNHPDFASDETSGDLQRQQSISMKDLADLNANIVMKKGARIFGRLTSADSKDPISDAVIVWGDDPYNQRGSQETRANKNGEYRFPTMKSAKKRVTVLAPGFHPASKIVNVRPEMPATDFELKPGKKLQIQFKDPDGNPIPRVYVTVLKWRDSEAMYNHRHPNVLETKIPRFSNSDGLYTWDWAPSDPVTFSFGSNKFASKRDVELAAADEPHEIELTPSLYVSGTVTDEQGESLKSFSVIPMTVMKSGAHERRDRGFVSTDGFFEITSQREDAGLQVKIEAFGYETHLTKVYRTGDEFEPLDIVLKAVEPLEYEVFDVDGKPAAGANVFIAVKDERLMLDFNNNELHLNIEGKKLSTDPDGKFQLGPPTKPRTLIAYSNDGYGEVADLPDKPAAQIQLKKWFEVHGDISVDGEFDDARVTAFPARFIHGSSYHIQQRHDGRSRQGGQFRMKSLPPMPVRLSFNRDRKTDPRQRRYSIAVEPKTDSLELELAHKVSGQIELNGGDEKTVNLLKSRIVLQSVSPTVELPAELQKLIKKNRLDPKDSDQVNQFFTSIKNEHAKGTYRTCFDRYSIQLDKQGKFDLRVMRPGKYEMTVELNPDTERHPFMPLGEFKKTLEIKSSGVDLGQFNVPTFPGLKPGAIVENLMFENRKTGLPTWLESLRERYVLIDFWKPWDETSKSDSKKLKELAKDLLKDEVTVLSLHTYNRTEGERLPKQMPKSLTWIDGKVEINNLRAYRKTVAALTPQYYLLIDPEGKYVAGGDIEAIEKALRESELMR